MSNPAQSPLDLNALPGPMDLTQHNTLGLVCMAQQVLTISSLEQLPAVSILARQASKTLVLGGGSNVVLPTALQGLVLRVELKGIQYLTLNDGRASGGSSEVWCIDVAAGENWHDWVVTATKNGWVGLENLALIPGTVGAAPVQNIGAYGVELQDRIESVDRKSVV
jgi:UDP-N-acetylmuramate dehydrogenase